MSENFSRTQPSPRYRELIRLYQQMHEEGEKFLGIPAAETFPGHSLPPQAHRIARLIDLTDARTLLDYGSGKGLQYQKSPIEIPGEGTFNSIQDYWVVDSIHCYDPNYTPYSQLPTGKFDGVICTDVLEHCPEPDLPWILDEIFHYANKFVFANVACYPAKKRLANGENAHCTIQPPAWWIELIRTVAGRYPLLKWKIIIQHLGPQGVIETPLANY
jgi:hypothetical protein